MGSSQTRARTRVPCIGRRIPNHCATREGLSEYFWSTVGWVHGCGGLTIFKMSSDPQSVPGLRRRKRHYATVPARILSPNRFQSPAQVLELGFQCAQLSRPKLLVATHLPRCLQRRFCNVEFTFNTWAFSSLTGARRPTELPPHNPTGRTRTSLIRQTSKPKGDLELTEIVLLSSDLGLCPILHSSQLGFSVNRM